MFDWVQNGYNGYNLDFKIQTNIYSENFLPIIIKVSVTEFVSRNIPTFQHIYLFICLYFIYS